MAKHLNKGVPFAEWPSQDRQAFEKLINGTDLFDGGPWAHLSTASVRKRRYGYGQWLGFLLAQDENFASYLPRERVDVANVTAFVEALRRNCTDTSVSIAIQHLRLTIGAINPDQNWEWLYKVERRLAKRAAPLPKALVLSIDLYKLGLAIMDNAKSKASYHGRPILAHAERYRDGLIIAMLAEAPMRRAGFVALCIHESVIKIAGKWRIFLTSDMVKTRVAQDFELSERLGFYLDEYLLKFRPVFPNADGHNGMWPYGNRPMVDKMIRRYIRKHTEAYLGVAVTPHDFRRAAATFIATADPANVLAAKDLLGHQSFAMTEKHYLHGARSRLAANVLAEALSQRVL